MRDVVVPRAAPRRRPAALVTTPGRLFFNWVFQYIRRIYIFIVVFIIYVIKLFIIILFIIIN